ncbi:response regulator transcription factor [uncultured Clostridium sp.]|uniref:response regulator transcription factor n=1 Tax=uncultured Clostridium sp. TaxID=59620 RepID=UPI0028E90768|nr:response regulator transcription factor [uncultured Clostridium sp.]
MSIRVVIADDDIMVREGMKIILSLDEEIEVVGTCSNGDEAFRFCQGNPVDVILMDIRMPVCDGVLGTKKICEAFPKIKVLILTTFNDDEYIVEALKNGASGYLLKNILPEEVIKAVKIVNEGNMLIHPSIAEKVPYLLKKEDKKDFSKYNLKEVEIEIMKLISEGYSNKEIAEKVFLSQGTVKNKITDIFSKLNLRDRTQIAIFYLKDEK